MEIKKKTIVGVSKFIIKSLIMGLLVLFALALIACGIVFGIMTLLPSEVVGWGADSVCYLGYVAHCSFTPFSTLILFGMTLGGFLMLIPLYRYFRKKIHAIKEHGSLLESILHE